MSNAIEHVLAIEETSAKLQECNYLRLSLPKSQECISDQEPMLPEE